MAKSKVNDRWGEKFCHLISDVISCSANIESMYIEALFQNTI